MVRNHIVVKIVLGIILSMMVITAIGNYRGFYPKKDYIITINGQKISRLQFEESLNLASQLLGQEFAKIITNENAMQQFRNLILQNIIDEVLLQQYVKKLRININDEQIKPFILNQRDFMINGKFNNVKYRNVLKIMGITGKQYAEALRKQLAVQELLSTIVKTDFLLPKEVNTLTRLVFQKRLVRKAVIDIKSMAAKTPISEDEINNFYQKHLNYFMLPEQFRISYLKLDTNKISKPYVSEFEIKQWYDSHKLDYMELPQYKYRIIQLKTEKEAKLLLKELKNGADFVKIAKEKSIDPISAPRGGQIGWISTEEIPDELKNLNLQKVGQLSGIIKSPIGYLIIRLDGIKSKHLMPLNKVRTFITNKIQEQKILEKYYSLQKKILELSNSISIKELEHLTGIKTEETNWFNLTTTIPNNLNIPAVRQAISSKRSNTNTWFFIPVSSQSGFWIRIIKYKSAHLKSLSRVHNSITTYLQRQKIEKKVKAELEKILSLLNQGKSEVDLNLKFGNEILLTRSSNTDTTITNTVFDMIAPQNNQSSTYASSQDAKGNLVIIALDKIGYVNASKKQIMSISSHLIKNQINMSLVALLNDLRKNSIIQSAE
ncbi:MAG: peptidylprolyl isomerase [Candidatus Dasytiphilus stammeri]